MEVGYEELLRYTKDHFIRLARENRFPENDRIPHDRDRCLVCHPEAIKGNSSLFFLDLVVECISERRSKIDEDLIQAIKEELEMNGMDRGVELEGLLEGDQKAFEAWRLWAWNAINTAFEMLSIHGDSAPYLQLEDGFSEEEVDIRLRYLFNKQLSNTAASKK
ncbi:MAG: hypothetical protein N2260_09470 [Syntrophobacterales bacterium]|nr:hypothetical protein [Syntrophobacterales bacterium]